MDKSLRADGPMKLVLCGCGRLHVTCGPVTLHFDRDELLAFADGVNRLAAMVKRHPAGLAPAARPGAHTEVCH
ncbi:hypothetical protein ACO9S2_04345 [Nitrospira sp. NS4]|uniref:hypothetical protein n=1 Tax=Nitrospira sp. NS4 TaxID=3414498 RepID=UPI003C2CF3D4